MLHLTQLAELRATLAIWRSAGERIALVPTMGNLHRGHLALVEAAQRHAAHVVVSIFVNPLQFGVGEDLAAYPRTLAEDQRHLETSGCALLFAPAVAEMYPHGQAAQTRLEVPDLSTQLCGASRPWHFAGVATVVCKLFNMVQPDVALFGEKDFQQLLVIRRFVRDLNLPLEIIGLPTVREADGLALSSRNSYLSPAERARAPLLYQTLTTAAQSLQSGAAVAAVEQAAVLALQAADFKPDYVAVRRAADLAPVTAADEDLVVLAAAQLGRTRLIDNVRVTR
ncbi:pantoate--beta-alanine ligase [Chromatium okenii]|uniref:pantoate--beta-alanine ligase n=1 Tax=Chromatium okenii TaxID=61644 RepID=UPI001908202A|nr:pantoate--beta-alanine ligase [Chromatium okenii]MBK1641121.1 pantoate--beta-alanine ligase [Chromatium okenii]